MRSNTATLPERTEEASEQKRRIVQCEHFWVIETANGPVSSGVCRLCGSRREFFNYLSDCLADKDRDRFEEWVVKQGREKVGRRGSLEKL